MNFGEDQGSLLEASSLLSSASHAILECFLLFPAILLWNIKWFSVWIRVYISMCHTEKKNNSTIVTWVRTRHCQYIVLTILLSG